MGKICVISFDHWNYDHHIIAKLNELGHQAHHIKIGGFKHKNFIERIQNTFSKIFLKTNPKLKKRQDFILETLVQLGSQDQILVINPELIDREYHLEIKKKTKKYIAYLYDSVERNPIDHIPIEIFDQTFSFDTNNCEKFGFSKISNYIYDIAIPIATKIENDLIYIGSIDERMDFLEQIGDILKSKNLKFTFYCIGKKAFVYNLKKAFTGKFKNITFQKKRFNQNTTLLKYSQSNIILDIVRQNQSGLSFRIFEGLGLKKKLITNNQSILNYDLHQIDAISYVNKLEDFNNIDTFINSKPNFENRIINNYKLENWVKRVFNLDFSK
ncbi:hypothetical protein [Flavobacterium sp.]|uniref:hypothetical protein n=1 Tax=Flavobacterium sp. TaxID=239 RepID=UPI003D0D1F87